MEPTRPPVIGFLTDFGLDGAAATCRGVMLSICPDAQIVDISHTVAKYAIRDGAFILRSALPYLPVGVHVGVVDPGVGTERRPIAIRTDRGDVLVGPDNGLLVEPAEALGGVREVRVLTNRDLWLPVTTHTFHGRDMFAPTAAHLAGGHATFEQAGTTLDPGDLVVLPPLPVRTSPGTLEAAVIYVDSFGNCRLSAGRDDFERAFGSIAPGTALRLEAGSERLTITYALSFGHVEAGAALLYIDSSGNLALALNQGDLGSRLAISDGARVGIRQA